MSHQEHRVSSVSALLILNSHLPSVPFAQTDASIKSPSVAPSSLFGSPIPSPSPGTHLHDHPPSKLGAPTWTNTPSIPTPTPMPALSSTSALELHRPQSAHSASPSPPPTQDQLMQAAFQQLMQSPSHVQRLMQLLSSGSTNGSVPIPTPMTAPTQPGSWTPPATLDLPQLAFYDNGISGGGNNALTFDSHKDTVHPSATQLAEDEARLAHTYHDASEIDADVDVLQANINALIENMGFNSAELPTTTPSATSTHPPPMPLSSSEGGMPPLQTPADFDFESFLTAFADSHDNEVGADVVVEDNSLSVPRSVVSGSGSASGTGTDATNMSTEQSVLTGLGRKRTSDVAELGPPLSEPSKLMLSSRAVATRTDALAADPARVKRNKK